MKTRSALVVVGGLVTVLGWAVFYNAAAGLGWKGFQKIGFVASLTPGKTGTSGAAGGTGGTTQPYPGGGRGTSPPVSPGGVGGPQRGAG